MEDLKQIIFKESECGTYSGLLDVLENWVRANKSSIEIKQAMDGIIEELIDGVRVVSRTVTIWYTGSIPATVKKAAACQHTNTETTRVEPTCVLEGSVLVTCKECYKTLSRSILTMIPHDLSYTYNNDHSCVKDGTESATCTCCKQSFKRIVRGTATGHPNTHHAITDPTCTALGFDKTVCDDCGTVLNTVSIPMVPHEYEWTFNEDATCLKDGTETGRCTGCGKEIQRAKAGSALGHTYPDSWTEEVAPTYTTEGLEYRECARCGDRQERIIPSLDFNMEITTALIDGAMNGQAFSHQMRSNQTEVTWAIASGTLPTGLTMNAAGLISGTPSGGGIFTFTISCQKYSKVVTKEFTMNVASKMCKVTFNANGGNVSPASVQVPQYSTIGTLPVATRSGQVFGGWFTAATDGLKVDANYTITGDTTVYARWGESSDVEFSEVTTQFNIQINGERTNYNNNPYTLYHRYSNGNESNLAIQTGISSADKTNNLSSSNKKITLYLKVTNNGAAGNFDVGFDCDSYAVNDDKIVLTRIANGIKVSNLYQVTTTNAHTVWLGTYNDRTDNRFVNVANGTTAGTGTSNEVDTGYAFTLNNIFINSNSYAIIPITFQML